MKKRSMMETSMGSSVFCIDSKLPNTQTVQTVYQNPPFLHFTTVTIYCYAVTKEVTVAVTA